MFVGLSLAALLIGAGFLLTDSGDRQGLSSSAEAFELVTVGSDQVQAFKFVEGAKNLEAALELDPNLVEAAIPLAFAYARLGRYSEYRETLALADSLTLLIKDDDRRMLAQMRLGVRHRSLFSDMIDSLMVRLKKDQPDNIHVMVTEAELLSLQQKKEEEYKAWQRILVKNPNYAEAYNRLGYFEMNRGNYQAATEHMKKYAFLAPDLANPHDSLGDVLMVLGKYEDAASEFRAAVSIQRDFYDSYINLGKTYLFRGMNHSGFEIMQQVEKMVEGTDLGETVDQKLMLAYLEMDLISEASQMTKTYVQRYPKQDLAAFFRAINLLHCGHVDEGQALIDSTLTAWRASDGYKFNPRQRLNIDLAEKNFQAYLADDLDQPSTRIRQWKSLISLMGQAVPIYKQTKSHIKLATAYLDNNEPEKARQEIQPILATNNRLIPALLLAVRIDLTMRDAGNARIALEQLKWSIQQSDDDFFGRQQAADLETLVIELEGNS